MKSRILHYAFPLILTLAWPAVVLGSNGVRLPLLMPALSIVLFVVLGGVNLDKAPWRSLDAPNFRAIGLYEQELRQAASETPFIVASRSGTLLCR